jgi:hypothetical protein
MKHTVSIFSFVLILVIFPGCATKAAITMPDYDELILKDIVQVISWFDTAQYFSSAVSRAQTVASAFLETYPDEREVVLAFLEISLDMAQDIKNSYLAIRSYTQMHDAYISNKTETQGEILYQSLTDIVMGIDRWYIKYPAWGIALDLLKNAMDRRGFDYSAVQ